MVNQKFNTETHPKTLIYVIENDTFTKRCNMCGSPVLTGGNGGKEKPFQCMACDVELYEIETHEGDYHTPQEFDELLCDVRDLLLLDD